MKPIFSSGKSHQFKFILVILVSVGLLIAGFRLEPIRQYMGSALAPLQLVASMPGRLLDWSVQTLATREQLLVQNRELIRQQLLMGERLQRFEHLRQENDRLRTLLGSPIYMDDRKMVAEALEVASDPYKQFVVLDRGYRSGVFVGQPVVDALGVVGQVVQVNALTSRILLLSDPNHAIPVRITRNDVRLIAAGTGHIGELELEYVAKSTDIKVGDLLVTSGLGGRFPEGYPVGRVTSVDDEDSQSYFKVTAKPLAALDRIRYVLLIWPDEKQVPAPIGPDMELRRQPLHTTPLVHAGVDP